jgi:PUA domain protein
MTPKLEVHQRHFLKSKDKKDFIRNLFAAYPDISDDLSALVDKKSKIEWIKLGNNEELYAIDDNLAFWLKNEKFIPLISFFLKNDVNFKYVVVDDGAIKFVAKGADIMRPGIIKIDPNIKKGDTVLIRDPKYHKVLAIGQANFNATEMEAKDKGKVIKSLHSLADDIWEFSKNF